MTYNIIRLDPKRDQHGKVFVVRFGVSFFEGDEPFLDVMGFLLTRQGEVRPPQTYSQYGRRTGVNTFSDDFLNDLQELFSTHPVLAKYRALVVPSVVEVDEEDQWPELPKSVTIRWGKE